MIIIHGVNEYLNPLPRLLSPVVVRALSRFPVVVVTGARQTGKTTLVTMDPVDRGRAFRSLDDFDVLHRAEEKPHLLLQEGRLLTLDEVQRAPNVLLAVKRAVDRDRRRGRFLLTGSANLLMMRRVSESLAGRAVYVRLCPMTLAEKAGHTDALPWERLLEARNPREASSCLRPVPPFRGWMDQALPGGYPVPALDRDPGAREAWFDGYVRTYLERDLQDVAGISSLVDFQRLMKLAAIRLGQMINRTSLARDAGLSQPTAHRWLNLLETTLQIVMLPAFSVNRNKRLVRTPKLYWTDVGLGAHLAGIRSPRDADDAATGALLENLVLAEILAWRETISPRPEVTYWRTHIGDEVDFVIERGRRVLPVEVKASARVTLGKVRSLEVFLEDYPKLAPWGMVLYGGREPFRLSERILAVPLGTLAGTGGVGPLLKPRRRARRRS